ncbi:hypothetical protein HY003_00770 [Candidatus Saccharibacteria bacterium]|nr:hypothetical protein [Candidatus Saccharibacteria bacterium]MBI3337815.1 hypothetical protein [Candidatus Saccharibacteria bacterium]
MTEGEVALATSREDRPLPLGISWSGDGGVLRKSSILLLELTYGKERWG